MKIQREQLLLNFDAQKYIEVDFIDKRGWRRISVASGRCRGNCDSCTCIQDLQSLTKTAAIEKIGFGGSGNPILTEEQIFSLRFRREICTPNEYSDALDISISIPPAPLEMCRDDDL